jgi:hypothetical protein
MTRWPLLAASLALVLAGPALAQESKHAVKAEEGKDARLLVVYSLQADCTPGPLNMPRIVNEPTHGKVRVARAKLRTKSTAKCPSVEMPGLVVLYRSEPGFSGRDSVLLEIEGTTGKTSRRGYDITVRPRSDII